MLAKNLLNNKESDHELPDKISVTNAETPSIRKRKACVLTTEKHAKSLRQSSPRKKFGERGCLSQFFFRPNSLSSFH